MCVGHPGSVLSRTLAWVEQKGEEPEFVSCPGMRKTEELGIAWDMSWHVALNKQQRGCSGQQGNTPCGTKYQLPAGTLRVQDVCACGCKRNPLFPVLEFSSAELAKTLRPH